MLNMGAAFMPQDKRLNPFRLAHKKAFDPTGPSSSATATGSQGRAKGRTRRPRAAQSKPRARKGKPVVAEQPGREIRLQGGANTANAIYPKTDEEKLAEMQRRHQEEIDAFMRSPGSGAVNPDYVEPETRVGRAKREFKEYLRTGAEILRIAEPADYAKTAFAEGLKTVGETKFGQAAVGAVETAGSAVKEAERVTGLTRLDESFSRSYEEGLRAIGGDKYINKKETGEALAILTGGLSAGTGKALAEELGPVAKESLAGAGRSVKRFLAEESGATGVPRFTKPKNAPVEDQALIRRAKQLAKKHGISEYEAEQLAIQERANKPSKMQEAEKPEYHEPGKQIPEAKRVEPYSSRPSLEGAHGEPGNVQYSTTSDATIKRIKEGAATPEEIRRVNEATLLGPEGEVVPEFERGEAGGQLSRTEKKARDQEFTNAGKPIPPPEKLTPAEEVRRVELEKEAALKKKVELEKLEQQMSLSPKDMRRIQGTFEVEAGGMTSGPIKIGSKPSTTMAGLVERPYVINDETFTETPIGPREHFENLKKRDLRDVEELRNKREAERIIREREKFAAKTKTPEDVASLKQAEIDAQNADIAYAVAHPKESRVFSGLMKKPDRPMAPEDFGPSIDRKDVYPKDFKTGEEIPDYKSPLAEITGHPGTGESIPSNQYQGKMESPPQLPFKSIYQAEKEAEHYWSLGSRYEAANRELGISRYEGYKPGSTTSIPPERVGPPLEDLSPEEIAKLKKEMGKLPEPKNPLGTPDYSQLPSQGRVAPTDESMFPKGNIEESQFGIPERVGPPKSEANIKRFVPALEEESGIVHHDKNAINHADVMISRNVNPDYVKTTGFVDSNTGKYYQGNPIFDKNGNIVSIEKPKKSLAETMGENIGSGGSGITQSEKNKIEQARQNAKRKIPLEQLPLGSSPRVAEPQGITPPLLNEELRGSYEHPLTTRAKNTAELEVRKQKAREFMQSTGRLHEMPDQPIEPPYQPPSQGIPDKTSGQPIETYGLKGEALTKVSDKNLQLAKKLGLTDQQIAESSPAKINRAVSDYIETGAYPTNAGGIFAAPTSPVGTSRSAIGPVGQPNAQSVAQVKPAPAIGTPPVKPSTRRKLSGKIKKTEKALAEGKIKLATDLGSTAALAYAAPGFMANAALANLASGGAGLVAGAVDTAIRRDVRRRIVAKGGKATRESLGRAIGRTVLSKANRYAGEINIALNTANNLGSAIQGAEAIVEAGRLARTGRDLVSYGERINAWLKGRKHDKLKAAFNAASDAEKQAMISQGYVEKLNALAKGSKANYLPEQTPKFTDFTKITGNMIRSAIGDIGNVARIAMNPKGYGKVFSKHPYKQALKTGGKATKYAAWAASIAGFRKFNQYLNEQGLDAHREDMLAPLVAPGSALKQWVIAGSVPRSLAPDWAKMSEEDQAKVKKAAEVYRKVMDDLGFDQDEADKLMREDAARTRLEIEKSKRRASFVGQLMDYYVSPFKPKGKMPEYYRRILFLEVKDGDTAYFVDLRKTRDEEPVDELDIVRSMRLQGYDVNKGKRFNVDAPEIYSPGGEESKKQLRKLLPGGPVPSLHGGADYYGRSLEAPLVNERDLATQMKESGALLDKMQTGKTRPQPPPGYKYAEDKYRDVWQKLPKSQSKFKPEIEYPEQGPEMPKDKNTETIRSGRIAEPDKKDNKKKTGKQSKVTIPSAGLGSQQAAQANNPFPGLVTKG